MSKQQLPQAVMSIFALSCPLLSHGQQNKAHGPQTWRALGTAGIALLTHLPLGAHTNVTTTDLAEGEGKTLPCQD